MADPNNKQTRAAFRRRSGGVPAPTGSAGRRRRTLRPRPGLSDAVKPDGRTSCRLCDTSPCRTFLLLIPTLPFPPQVLCPFLSKGIFRDFHLGDDLGKKMIYTLRIKSALNNALVVRMNLNAFIHYYQTHSSYETTGGIPRIPPAVITVSRGLKYGPASVLPNF